jgi:hypothetical protein
LLKEKKHEHIVHRKEGWAVRSAGSERPSSIFTTRAEAIDYARELAIKHNVCMVVHDEDGKFKEFNCKPEFKNRHVVKKGAGWAVIAEGGSEVEQIFETKGAAMAYAYELAEKHNVCALIHSKDGKIESKDCSPEDHPGILEVFYMNLQLYLSRL